MPTISGLRRRGFTPESIRDFCDRIGVAKKENVVDVALLEHCVREDLNKRAPRAMAVLRPLEVVIENYPDDQVEHMDVVNNPEHPSAGTRKVPFSRVLYIEQDDFREDPPKKFFRLAPGREVRLRNAYLVTCREVVKDPATARSSGCCAPTTRPPAAAMRPTAARSRRRCTGWQPRRAVDGEVRLYERLFSVADPSDDEGKDWRDVPEPALARPRSRAASSSRRSPRCQKARACSSNGWATSASIPTARRARPVFNRTVTLKDAWARMEAREGTN